MFQMLHCKTKKPSVVFNRAPPWWPKSNANIQHNYSIRSIQLWVAPCRPSAAASGSPTSSIHAHQPKHCSVNHWSSAVLMPRRILKHRTHSRVQCWHHAATVKHRTNSSELLWIWSIIHTAACSVDTTLLQLSITQNQVSCYGVTLLPLRVSITICFCRLDHYLLPSRVSITICFCRLDHNLLL